MIRNGAAALDPACVEVFWHDVSMSSTSPGATARPSSHATNESVIEFYFDFTCPFAYLASTQIETLAQTAGAALYWRPMLLGGVFRSIGDGSSPMTRAVEVKARHTDLDMRRFAERLGVPLSKPAGHPLRSVRALRALLSLPEADWPHVVHAVYRGYWQRGVDIAAPSALAALLRDAGVAEPMVARALAGNDRPEQRAELRRRTDEAVARGVFGAPAMFVWVPDREQPYGFWGQDRLHLVRAVLAGWRPERGAPTAAHLRAAEPADEGPSRAPTRPRRVDFFYDFSSPFTYLGATQIERVAASAGAELRWRPMLLGAVFREIGTPNVPLNAMAPPKREYYVRDLEHWASYWHQPFVFASHFPQRSVTALRLALLAGERIAELSHALFRIPWVDDGDIADRATLARVLTECGFYAEDMLARTSEPGVKQMLFDNTAEAVARGVFGSPTFVVEDVDGARDELFWGQDRLQLVADALRG